MPKEITQQPLEVALLLTFVPFLLIALSIPLILRKIPPKRWYGFRTPKTLSSGSVWYQANYVGGKYLLIAGIIELAIFLFVAVLQPADALTYGTFIITVPLAVAIIAWFIRLRAM